jgi:dCMP deaminase
MSENTDKREQKWMLTLLQASKVFSTCSKRQYAAVVISDNGRVVGFGYNGGPPGYAHCSDGACPRVQEGSPNGSNYDNCIAIHAEANALMWSDPSLRRGATLIVNGPPCFGCAKLIVAAGISKVVCEHDPHYLMWPQVEEFFKQCNVATRVMKSKDIFKGVKL